MKAVELTIHGIVQGVGFRPFVYNLARGCGLCGWVLNAGDGVHIHVEGNEEAVASFIERLPEDAPPMSRVERIESAEADVGGFLDFEIRFSDDGTATTTQVSPDIATCPSCLEELFDPQNRRYHYPFINCTQCGPRFTIIDSLPYDRPATSMAYFAMCPDCDAEYHNPANRRFHAQPNACFECGPQLTWTQGDETTKARDLASSDALIERAAALIEAGGILAVKGLGGYHLACDARNEEAVATLRERKHRPDKPFALMVRDLEAARDVARVSEREAALLTGSVRPIVLLSRKDHDEIAPNVAAGLPEVGIMLPYTPLQHLLLGLLDRPLVMTSGNLTEEPIVAGDEEAHGMLGDIADAFLGNDRAIRSRYDDSVVRVCDEVVVPVRRARGYAPTPLPLPEILATGPDLLACGPEQKNTFCFARGGHAFVSQHLGDLENALSYGAWEDTVELYEHLFDMKPQVFACDMHPEYLATKWAHAHAEGRPLIEVQHHHAHIAAIMGEHALEGPVIGVALDGTGYGEDGTIWGGEILLCTAASMERFAHVSYMPMPGGAAAVKHPIRMAAGLIRACDLDERATPLLETLMGIEELGLIRQMMDKGVNCPATSSAGRLLDAMAALCGLSAQTSYEGQPAIEFEATLEGAVSPTSDTAYPFELEDDGTPCGTTRLLINPAPAVAAALDDIESGCSPKTVSEGFHTGFADAIVESVKRASGASGSMRVALGGGVFQNRFLLHRISTLLKAAGFSVYTGVELPANDGCISYGQAIVARAKMIERQ